MSYAIYVLYVVMLCDVVLRYLWCIIYILYVLYVFMYSILRIPLFSVHDKYLYMFMLYTYVYTGIASLMGAGIKLWVLTGDKEGTAINVAIACNVLQVGQSYDPFLLTYSSRTYSSHYIRLAYTY